MALTTKQELIIDKMLCDDSKSMLFAYLLLMFVPFFAAHYSI